MSDKNPEVEFFSQLYDALTDEPRHVRDVRAFLKKRGIDVDGTVDHARQLIADSQSRRRLQEARERFERLREAIQGWTARERGSGSSVRDDLARALAGERGDIVYRAYHRKLEKVSHEDLASLNEDAELLEFLERMEPDEPE